MTSPLHPMPRKVIAAVAAGIAIFTIALVAALWWGGTAGLTGKELVTARLDALRTGLSIGLGGGGLFALYLAWRRQHSTEVGLVQTERDAAGRRVTELYAKSSEQLGSDKAPVRLAGIYALERLAQDVLEQRQTIVNLLCAYLRMPYQPPDDTADPERVQEREVRRTAQQVLVAHLRPADEAAFWGALDLNLGGAVLFEADFSNCRVGLADFRRAVFLDVAYFRQAEFTGPATFVEAEFRSPVSFTLVDFGSVAHFSGVTFRGADFIRTRFGELAVFSDARFLADEKDGLGDRFTEAVFEGGGIFQRTRFDAGADLTGARVSAGSTSVHSVWPGNWVSGEDGTISEG